jgi:thioredoxin reductase (NADPH)
VDKRRRDRIPYQWLDIEQDAEAVALVEATARATEEDTVPLPIVFFPDGTQLIDPDNRTLAEKVGP